MPKFQMKKTEKEDLLSMKFFFDNHYHKQFCLFDPMKKIFYLFDKNDTIE